MKTAMQELIEFLDTEVTLGFCTKEYAERLKWYINTYSVPKERQQIIDAVDDGQRYNDGFVYENGEQYFNQTYNNETDKQQNSP